MSDIVAGTILENYEFVRVIGRGGFSTVWLVKSLKFDRLFVAKVAFVKKDIEEAWRGFDCEIKALLRLDHPNIIKLYAHFRYETNFILILEYLEKGSLSEYIRKNGPVDSVLLYQIVHDICCALRFAWSLGVQHRDIKPENIMFDERGRAKLVDFGISVTTKDVNASTGEVSDFRCSPLCVAPEILKKVPYDPVKSDMWAMGITILWMAKGSVPWRFNSATELDIMIRVGKFVVPDRMDLVIKEMAKRMLAVIPQNRVFPSDEELETLGREVEVVKSRVKKVRGIMPAQSFELVKISEQFRKVQPMCQLPGARKRILIQSPIMKLATTPKSVKPVRVQMGLQMSDADGSVRKSWHMFPVTSIPLKPMEPVSGQEMMPDIGEG